MTEDLDYLLNLLFASDGRRDLIRASQPVERNSEVLEVRRKFKLLSVLFFFLFPFLNLCPYVLLNSLGVCPHCSQNVHKQTVMAAQCFKNVCSFNRFTTL